MGNIDQATAYHTDDYSRIDCSAVIVQGKDGRYRLRTHAPGEKGQLGPLMESYRSGDQDDVLNLLRDWMNSKTGDNRPIIQQLRRKPD
ncbi:hypothetical protein [Iodobacter fluviatilis]|uniref:Uncharacterized protein n=1 Tax=Iodobacter fluviatilis TaxID=537 RepID=A0A7G3GAN4_9NEIS|nr:hypothetical protein [Iodobacter fluviatilis]QBC44437.1 hypothetical protein C1H71_13460 [Iodobacter fluviatilis]